MNHRFQGSVQAENGLGINTCLAKFSCSLLGKPRTMKTNLNQPAGCEEALAVGGCLEGRGNSALISPSQPQSPQQPPGSALATRPLPLSYQPASFLHCPLSLVFAQGVERRLPGLHNTQPASALGRANCE